MDSFKIFIVAVCLIGQSIAQTGAPPKKQQQKPGQNNFVEVALQVKTFRSVLISRMAEKGFQLQDESEHLLTFSKTDSRRTSIKLTLVELDDKVRVFFDRQADPEVVALLKDINAEALIISARILRAEGCNQSLDTVQDRVNQYGESLRKLGCYPAKDEMTDACKKYWQKYRENVDIELEKLKSEGCEANVSSFKQ
jgi:hypothetical protein